jgi:hypothetical protein
MDKVLVVLTAVLRMLPELQTLDAALIKVFTVKQQAVAKAYTTYSVKASRTNLNTFMKAVTAWQATKLTGPKQATDEHILLLRGMLWGLKPALMEHGKVQASKKAEADAEFQHVLTNAAKIAGGLEAGRSWKADLTPDLSLQDVLDHAALEKPNGLLHGPGQQNSALKVEIEKASAQHKMECTKYSITELNQDLYKEAQRLIDLSQATVLESQLVRCFNKPLAEQTKGVEKYLLLYAHVAHGNILTQIWTNAQQIMKGR